MYALKYKNKFDFLCVSNTQEGFEKKIVGTFLKWKGIQACGSKKTIDDFLSGFDKVMVTVEPHNDGAKRHE